MTEFYGQMTDGMQVADLHIHTSYSADGHVSPEERVDFAVQAGFLNAMAITDHNTIRGGMTAQEYASKIGAKIEVIVGSEVSTANGHLIGLFLEKDVPEGEFLLKTLERIHDQGGVAILPHPTLRRVTDISPADMFLMVKFFEGVERVDGFEVYNDGVADRFAFRNYGARKFHLKYGDLFGAAVGGSDNHYYTTGGGVTAYRGDLRSAIKKRETVVARADLDEWKNFWELAQKIHPDVQFNPKLQERKISRLKAGKEENNG